MRIVVAAPQVPFVRGGAELMADDLVDALRARGHETDLVTLPFKWYPGTRVLDQAFLWRLVDLTESDGRAIDRVIATKFPAYCVRHPNKVAWVLHQFRQAYDYDRPSSASSASRRRTARRGRPSRASTLSRSARRGTSSRRPGMSPTGCGASTGSTRSCCRIRRSRWPIARRKPEGYVLSVNRLDRAKRIDLLIEAAKREPSLRIVIAGEGPDRARLESLASGLNGQVRFAGRVDDDELIDLYARSTAVFYAPVDEDFGMVPYEAFLSGKPVVTTLDAGGPLEIVRDRETGVVTEPDASAIADACAYLAGHADEATAWGHAGRTIAERVTWDACVDALLS